MQTACEYMIHGASDLPETVCSLVDVLRFRALQQPEKVAFTFLADGETEQSSLTYGELDQKVRALAGRLQSLGAKGQRAILPYPPGLEFIVGFFGCLFA